MALYTYSDLPARHRLADEGIIIEPLDDTPDGSLTIGVLNLMPVKADTETDLLRAFSTSSNDIAFLWYAPRGHISKNTPQYHIDRFYRHIDMTELDKVDALIVTGAPVEKIDYDNVDYMAEFCRIVDEARRHDTPVLLLCWAAFAGMYHMFGVAKQILPDKISGVFPHTVLLPDHKLMKGVASPLYAPQSRFVTMAMADIERITSVNIVAKNDAAGVHVGAIEDGSVVFITGHGEYAIDTLDKEYRRDMSKGLNPSVPSNYYKGDIPSSAIEERWQTDGRRIFSNWIEEIVAPSSRQKHARGCRSQAQGRQQK